MNNVTKLYCKKKEREIERANDKRARKNWWLNLGLHVCRHFCSPGLCLLCISVKFPSKLYLPTGTIGSIIKKICSKVQWTIAYFG
jgi:hypothetical protein